MGFLFQFLPILSHAEFNDAGNQVGRYGLIEGYLHGPFGCSIDRQLCFKAGNAAGCGKETDVILKSGEVNQIAVQVKGGHLVTDLLNGIRCGCVNDGTYLDQLLLNLCGKLGYILINRNSRFKCFFQNSCLINLILMPIYTFH